MPTSPEHTNNCEPSTDWVIFIPMLLLIIVIGVSLLVSPQAGASYASAAMSFVTGTFGWLYLSLGVGALGFALWLSFGPYRNVLLGTPGTKPEYADLHWIAMMFTVGIGGSLIAWGIAEPISYLKDTPFGIAPYSKEAMEWAHMYPMFHWGFIAWAFYAIPAVPIAYMLYIKQMPTMKISGACESALPATGRKFWRRLIDTVIILGIVGAVATSLGVGVPLVTSLCSELFGVPDDIITKLVVLLLWTMLFGASAYRGLKKGIKLLADINMVIAVLAILFIALAGPTIFILNITVNSVGLMVDNFFRMALWLDPIEKSGFPERWTVFYWAWWIAYIPLVALFVGRISKGRTIRQLVLGTIGWGTLGTTLFMAIIGGYGIFLQSSGALPLADILQNSGMAVVTAKTLAYLPFGKFALLVFIVLSIIFYATSFDSAAYTLASVCSKNLRNDQEPPRLSRLVWAFALALLALGLLATDNVGIVQASTVVFSLPLLPVIVLMCISLVKWLRSDFGPAAVTGNKT